VKVRADGTVKVLDFGLAKAFQVDGSRSRGQDPSSVPTTMMSPAMTQHGVILGTAAYMAPEQARGKVVDKRADIWAFGVVLFEMLTGCRAFAGDDMSEVLASVLKTIPTGALCLSGRRPPSNGCCAGASRRIRGSAFATSAMHA
jgi:serine/threonine protein kinase